VELLYISLFLPSLGFLFNPFFLRGGSGVDAEIKFIRMNKIYHNKNAEVAKFEQKIAFTLVMSSLAGCDMFNPTILDSSQRILLFNFYLVIES
jgi:hypothetical protein